jgi:hypothetical protein
MTMRALFLSLLLAAGCATEDHGVCETDESLLWFHKVQDGPLASNEWCVVCEDGVSMDEAADWVLDNAGESYLERESPGEGVTPCLFVYPTHGEDMSDPAVCEVDICEGEGRPNDPVYDGYGVWDFIEPLLFGE